jgi:hypothetical protein
MGRARWDVQEEGHENVTRCHDLYFFFLQVPVHAVILIISCHTSPPHKEVRPLAVPRFWLSFHFTHAEPSGCAWFAHVIQPPEVAANAPARPTMAALSLTMIARLPHVAVPTVRVCFQYPLPHCVDHHLVGGWSHCQGQTQLPHLASTTMLG